MSSINKWSEDVTANLLYYPTFKWNPVQPSAFISNQIAQAIICKWKEYDILQRHIHSCKTRRVLIRKVPKRSNSGGAPEIHYLGRRIWWQSKYLCCATQIRCRLKKEEHDETSCLQFTINHFRRCRKHI